MFALLTLASLLAGGWALTRDSGLVLVLVLAPLFGVLSLASGLSARR